MAHDIFVSYSNKDKPIADAVVAGLENKGLRCWIAPRDLTPGISWGKAITDAIEISKVMVVILSGNSNQSRQVVREVERAVARDVVVIPFRIENVDPTGAMAYFLSSEHWLDALTPPLEKHIEKLGSTIQLFLSEGDVSVIEEHISEPEGQPVSPPRSLWQMPWVGILLGIGALAVLCVATIAVTSLFILPRLTGEDTQTVAETPTQVAMLDDTPELASPTVLIVDTDTPVPPSPIVTEAPTEIPTTTATPMSVSDYPLPAGWQDYSVSDFSIGLPEGWEAVDVDREGVEMILNVLTNLDTDWAQNTAEMFSAEEMEEMLKFWAMDMAPAGLGYASVNVMFQSLPFPIKVSDMCAEMPSAYNQMGIELLDMNCDLEINGLDAAQFMTILHSGFGSVQQYQYLFLSGRNMWSLTLAVDETEWRDYKSVFETIAETFREN
jgi:hypothetical protein